MIHIKKGLDLPITGAPKQIIDSNKTSRKFALLGADYHGMKPSMIVKEGDMVKLGQPLFECKKTAGVVYTAPVAGKVVAINRGAKRAFQSLIIESSTTPEDQVSFKHFRGGNPQDLQFQQVVDLLQESGLWTALRTRPYSKVPAIDGQKPNSLFVNTMDTSPLAADSAIILKEAASDFQAGIAALSHLTEGKVFVCRKKGSFVPEVSGSKVSVQDFSGVHPAGNVGTHIHFLDPVGPKKTVWSIGYQDVIAVGRLFLTGKLNLERVISLAGPRAANPRLVKTSVGMSLNDIIQGETKGQSIRVVSGSVLNGRKLDEVNTFLGRYHTQVTLLEEDHNRELLGWHMPGFNKFSLRRTFFSSFIPGKKFELTTTTHGSPRAMVPVGMFEQVMPLDILPTQLLRALVTNDPDLAIKLGCLELDEEDIALCTFASPGKEDFGAYLRDNLTTIEKEG
jgi:Na+-transporting NADH:ubiquinone oxidoreductase subunit A